MRLQLGGEHDVLNPDNGAVLRFTHKDTALEPVFGYLTGLIGFASLVDIYKANKVESAKPWAADHYAAFDGKVCPVRLHWRPHHLVYAAINNGIPAMIEFEQFETSPMPADESLNLGALQHFMTGLSQSMIVPYYEDRKPVLKSKYGSPTKWPPVWQFAHTVRNAMSHGNKVNITNGKSTTWKGLTYTSASNGRKVVNEDLFPADLFILLRELEDTL